MSISFIIIFLLVFDIDFEEYNKGGGFLSSVLVRRWWPWECFFYEKYTEIKENLKAFVLAVIAGGISGILSIIVFLKFFNIPVFIIKSLAAKSVTAPIAIEITRLVGGVPEVTTSIVIAVGIFGNAFGPLILRILGIKSKIAIGTSLGTAAHAICTARAFEEGQLPGVYSGIAMCLNGVITALLTPYIVSLDLSFHGLFYTYLFCL